MYLIIKEKSFVDKDGKTVNYEEVNIVINDGSKDVYIPIKAVYKQDGRLFKTLARFNVEK